MKRLAFVLVASVVIASLAAPAYAQKSTGNGSQSGSHYNLNLIGTDKAKTQDLTGSNRHTIFVALNYNDPTPTDPTPLADLSRKNKIFLQEGPFQVLDGNAWDGALFQLPAPDCQNLTVGATNANIDCDYSVFVRGLGSPKGNPYANMTTCGIATDTTLGDYYVCSTETVTVSRTKGRSSFQNVTKELLTMCLDTNTDGTCDTRVQLFDSQFYEYFWDYDNFGLHLAQLRFYPEK